MRHFTKLHNLCNETQISHVNWYKYNIDIIVFFQICIKKPHVYWAKEKFIDYRMLFVHCHQNLDWKCFSYSQLCKSLLPAGSWPCIVSFKYTLSLLSMFFAWSHKRNKAEHWARSQSDTSRWRAQVAMCFKNAGSGGLFPAILCTRIPKSTACGQWIHWFGLRVLRNLGQPFLPWPWWAIHTSNPQASQLISQKPRREQQILNTCNTWRAGVEQKNHRQITGRQITGLCGRRMWYE